MNILNAIFQGIVQGLAEFLPVSSSGHLSIVQHFTSGGQGGDTFFTIMLHIGTLVAVFYAFRKEIYQYIVEFFSLIADIFRGKFSYKNMSVGRRNVIMIFVALLPLLVVYPFKDTLQGFAEDDNLYVEGVCFLVTSVLLFIAARAARRNSDNEIITLPMALIIGATQAIATLPGISRSGSTVAMALVLGLSKKSAFDFSFILGIPAVLGAALLDFVDVAKGEIVPDVATGDIIIGIIVSAVVGVAAIWTLRLILAKDKFQIFAYYTALVGVFCLAAVPIIDNVMVK